MSDLVEFLSNPWRWVQRRNHRKRIIAEARRMEGAMFVGLPGGGYTDKRPGETSAQAIARYVEGE